MWLAEAIATAHRRREQMRQTEAEFPAAHEALLLAGLLLRHAKERQAGHWTGWLPVNSRMPQLAAFAEAAARPSGSAGMPAAAPAKGWLLLLGA